MVDSSFAICHVVGERADIVGSIREDEGSLSLCLSLLEVTDEERIITFIEFA